MRFWIYSLFLLSFFEAGAMQVGLKLNESPEQRLVRCMDFLGTSFGQSRSAYVIQAAPTLRQKISNLAIQKAVVVMDFETETGHTLVLRAISRNSLQQAATESLQVEAGTLQTIELSAEDYEHFAATTKKIGSITLTFENQERLAPIVTLRGEALVTGTMLKIDNSYFAVINKTTGMFHEQGSRPQSTQIFELAAFKGKPKLGQSAEGGLRKLEIGGFWFYELDGREVGTITNLGPTTIEVHGQIGMNPSFSARLKEWPGENDRAGMIDVPTVRLKNYRPIRSESHSAPIQDSSRSQEAP